MNFRNSYLRLVGVHLWKGVRRGENGVDQHPASASPNKMYSNAALTSDSGLHSHNHTDQPPPLHSSWTLRSALLAIVLPTSPRAGSTCSDIFLHKSMNQSFTTPTILLLLLLLFRGMQRRKIAVKLTPSFFVEESSARRLASCAESKTLDPAKRLLPLPTLSYHTAPPAAAAAAALSVGVPARAPEPRAFAPLRPSSSSLERSLCFSRCSARCAPALFSSRLLIRSLARQSSVRPVARAWRSCALLSRSCPVASLPAFAPASPAVARPRARVRRPFLSSATSTTTYHRANHRRDWSFWISRDRRHLSENIFAMHHPLESSRLRTSDGASGSLSSASKAVLLVGFPSLVEGLLFLPFPSFLWIYTGNYFIRCYLVIHPSSIFLKSMFALGFFCVSSKEPGRSIQRKGLKF